jgi:GGDEF domain-containing protein
MQCGKTSSPDQLQLEIIYIYQLGEKGREICRHGVEIEDISKLMDSALIPAEVFMYSAKWLDHLSIRNEDQPFSIVAIKIKNVATLIEQKGYAEAHETMQALSERIREMIRCSDLIMRRSDELYFILLPSTPIEGVLILREKIAKALLSIQLDKRAYIEVKTDSFSSSVRDGNQLYDIENILNDLSNAVTE